MPKENEMKKLSNEELIENIQDAAILGKRDSVFVAELLRRLEAGDRAIKACREIVAMEIPE